MYSSSFFARSFSGCLLLIPKLLEVSRGVHYIHSEDIVHGDLHGVFCLNRGILNRRCANLSDRPMSSWTTNFISKSPILD